MIIWKDDVIQDLLWEIEFLLGDLVQFGARVPILPYYVRLRRTKKDKIKINPMLLKPCDGRFGGVGV